MCTWTKISDTVALSKVWTNRKGGMAEHNIYRTGHFMEFVEEECYTATIHAKGFACNATFKRLNV